MRECKSETTRDIRGLLGNCYEVTQLRSDEKRKVYARAHDMRVIYAMHE